VCVTGPFLVVTDDAITLSYWNSYNVAMFSWMVPYFSHLSPISVTGILP
jgi:hypothetical protein